MRDGKVTGISDLRDESDRDGMRIVIELKKDANPKVVLNQLFVHTPLQTTFGAIMLALVDNRPQVLTLRALLDQYVRAPPGWWCAAAPSSTSPRPRSAPTSSRASRSRSTTSTR